MRGLKILLALVLAVAVADIASATGSKTKPKPKPKPKPKRCPDGCGFGAVCKSGQCVCRSKREGTPTFACVPPRFFYYCQIASDPMLNTTDKQVAGIKMPASVALTSLTTRRTGKFRGTCNFSLGAWTERFEGKYFIQALSFKILQMKTGQKPTAIKMQIVAKVVNNEYFWTVSQRVATGWEIVYDFTPKSRRSVVKTFNGCSIRFRKIQSNFLYVNVACCAIRFALRPYNIDRPDIVPGVWLMTRNWAKLNSLPEGMCNSGKDAPNIDELKDKLGFTSRTQYTTYAGLAYGTPVQYPGAFEDLPLLQKTLRSCDNSIGLFMTKSEFLFNFAKLIACEKDRIMNITLNVAKGFCNGDVGACNNAIAAINADCPDAKKSNKQLKRFLKNGCV